MNTLMISHFTSEKTDLERLSDLPMVIQLVFSKWQNWNVNPGSLAGFRAHYTLLPPLLPALSIKPQLVPPRWGP